MFRAGALTIVAVLLAAAVPIPLPKPTDQGRPPIAQQSTEIASPAQNGAQGPQIGATAGNPLHVQAQCEHGCGYAEDVRTWVQKLWTDPVATFTAALAALTFGLIAVGGTQAYHLRQTILAMRDSERRQLRAYAGISSIAMECPELWHNEYAPTDHTIPGAFAVNGIRLNVENFGQTPAYEVCAFGYWHTTQDNKRLPEDFFARNDEDIVEQGLVRPVLAKAMVNRNQTESFRIPLFDISGLRAAVRDATSRIYIYGRIYYRDIYGRYWRTKFCHEWVHRSDEFIAYEKYNDEDQKRLGED